MARIRAHPMRLAAVLAAAVVLLLSMSCSSGSSRSNTVDTQEDTSVPTESDQLGWAGFSDVGDLDVVAVDGETGIDTMVRFALQGSPGDIDRALDAAGYSEPQQPGVSIFQTPLEEVDLDALVDPRSGEDTWVNPSGRTINRVFVRGETAEGQELIHVWAFTT